MNLESLIANAKRSKLRLWILNRALFYLIPFNKPHGISVLSITENELKASLPKRRLNSNHVNGSHACALAAAAEFSTGVLLLSTLSPAKYRIIMKKLEMNYHYQAKKDAVATCSLDPSWLHEAVIVPLAQSDRVVVTVKSELHDVDGNHLCTGSITWQIKEWSKVQAPLNSARGIP